jgi:tyrosyl-tRNA synthetase
MTFLNNLQQRGLLQDISDADLDKKLNKNDSFYVGFDPTSPNLHIGNLIQAIVAIHIARDSGMQPIILFGGSTGAIGDPSGRANERQLLTRETINANVASHSRIMSAIFERAKVKVEFVDNFEWTKDLTVLDFLRDIGKHFTVNYMIAKEVVKTRLNGEGISFTEFSYMLLQAFDFHYLFKNKNCRLQFGGSDQWGNLTAGLELIRKTASGDAFAFSIPLLVDSQGKKLGKTAAGAVWINRDGLSPYEFHQYLLNTSDQDVEQLLKIFTFLEIEEINDIIREHKLNPEKRSAQTKLADLVTSFVHGEDAVTEANQSRNVLFGGDISGLNDQQLLEIFSGVPSSEISRANINALSVIDLFVHTKICPSKGEARRLIQNGGAYINSQRMNDGNLEVSKLIDVDKHVLVLRSGKKNYHLVKIC